MNEEMVIGIGQEALKVTFLLAAPLLVVAMVVGIAVSLLQAITQINEATLSFIPKIVAIAIVLLLAAPWMLDTLSNYTSEIFTTFGEIGR
jgi:flagellar biosynthetic protein FliQ